MNATADGAYYRDLPDIPIEDAMVRGRTDPPWFSHYFLRRKLHDGQCEWMENANATINVLATANRYGKTTVVASRHFHRCFYKLGGEPKYLAESTNVVDAARYLSLKYQTIHSAGLWETAAFVWEDALKIIDESPRIRAFVKSTPRTLPPSINFHNGSKWRFKTLGDNGEGIDGYSFYLITIDEAGWILNLRQIMDNVGRVRVADVRGCIDIIGTFKPGVGRDFFYYANRASVSTGRKIGFDHQDGRDYGKEFGLE